MRDLTRAWLDGLRSVLIEGTRVAPRDKLTREVQQHTLRVDMRRPVLRVPARKLSYKFMAAEAYWILTGDDRVETIAPYNERIAVFSDDGERFFGAYGPKIAAQLAYVVRKLRQDPDTRQAGLTLWRENPPETKDVPCTVAIFFSIRRQHLHAHVFMRSSDLWLGVPYDVFNFSMLAHLVCAKLHSVDPERFATLQPGELFLTAASSHLYEEHWGAAHACLVEPVSDQPPTPRALWTSVHVLLNHLRELRETKPGDPLRWWEGAP